MPPRNLPSVSTTNPGKLLGEHLAIVRKLAGYKTQEALADTLRKDRTVIAKVESGDRAPSDDVLAAWLDACGVSGQLRALMEGLASIARVKEGGPVKVWFSGYLDAEGKAHTLRLWQPLIFHGLFQTKAYTRALFTAAGVPEDQIREHVQLREQRQSILTRPQRPNVISLLDQFVLDRPIGSPEVMKEQLECVLKLSQDMVIQVVPSRIGANAGLGGAITLAAATGTPEVLAAESLVEDQVTHDIPQVLQASATFDRVRADALPRAESRTAMEEALERWNSKIPGGGSPPTAPTEG